VWTVVKVVPFAVSVHKVVYVVKLVSLVLELTLAFWAATVSEGVAVLVGPVTVVDVLLEAAVSGAEWVCTVV